MRELGVGLVYWPALDELLVPGAAPVSVVELEPQTLWHQTADAAQWCYRGNPALLDHVAALPLPKLIHGIGQPLGGTVPDPLDYLSLLRQAVERLDPAWVSEHLSFNRIRREGTVEHAGFLLPARQSPAAVRVAAHNIDAFRRALGRPVAFETGVNYLRRQPGEMDDGEFFAAVSRAADSGILLDLHNLWCNERNGGQGVADALEQLPLERVWEIHLAGGMEESGYWLDAHSGAVPSEVLDIAAELIPRLPRLGAIIYEVLPEHVAQLGLDGVRRQIDELQRLWTMRRPRVVRLADLPPAAPSIGVEPQPQDIAEAAAWETALVDTLRAQARLPPTVPVAGDDPGLTLLARLVGDFRSASLARALHYTMTALLAGLGPRDTQHLLAAYFGAHPPEPFAAIEADRFARFLAARLPLLPRLAYLDEVLAFEHALVRAAIHGTSSDIAWSADPLALIASLDAGRLPRSLPPVNSVMRICAD
ncbi:MAG: DUF692 family multinuclear iron-containing protein [Telluria sp.]